MNKQFYIGIGSQRAGSTLLHKILSECTQIQMHPVKELHYFDSYFGLRDKSVLADFSRAQLRRINQDIIDGKLKKIDKELRCALRTSKICSSSSILSVDYIDLYRPLLLQNEHLGEITPEYMLLKGEQVEFMRSKVGDAIILMLRRNPVDRLISAFKLLKVYGKESPVIDAELFEEELLFTLDNMPEWVRQQRALNDYQGAEIEYKKYFSNVFVLDYEDILSSPEDFIYKLDALLPVSLDFDKAGRILKGKVNSLGENIAVSSETRDIIFEKVGKGL